MMIEFARSLAGHDKGKVYVVTSKEADFVFLSDGDIRKYANPKKKNIKHVQPIKKLPIEVIETLKDEHLNDLKIKRALKLYQELSVSMEE